MSIILNNAPIENPELSLFSFDIYATLGNAARQFPELAGKSLKVWIRRQKTLACIFIGDNACDIFLHSVLNHNNTPEQVMHFIFTHELLHTRIPGRVVDGVMKQHPPEFWEAEKLLVPERPIYWFWIHLYLGECIRSDKKLEATIVKRNWKKSMDSRRLSMEELVDRFEIKLKQKDESIEEVFL